MANKVAICMACGENNVKAKVLFSLVHALRNVDFDYDFFMQISCDLIGNRSRLVEQAKEISATHLLFLDHDMFFKEDAITKLLAQDKDIIGVPYNFRSFPLRSTAIPVDGGSETEPYKCQAVGTGFLLIKLSVFEKMEKPYFQFKRNEKNELVCGEDAWFCQHAIKAGFEVWADPTVMVKHIGEYIY